MTNRGAFGSAHASRHGVGGCVASQLLSHVAGSCQGIAILKARTERSPRGEREARFDRSAPPLFTSGLRRSNVESRPGVLRKQGR
jgi:hypothetical protein